MRLGESFPSGATATRRRKKQNRVGKKKGGRLGTQRASGGDSVIAMAVTAGGRVARRLLQPSCFLGGSADACTPAHSVPLRTAYGFYTRRADRAARGRGAIYTDPPQTECSRLTPCPLPFLHSGFTLLARIGVIRLFI